MDGVIASTVFWPVLAGLVFTAYAFTLAWRHLSRRRRRT